MSPEPQTPIENSHYISTNLSDRKPNKLESSGFSRVLPQFTYIWAPTFKRYSPNLENDGSIEPTEFT